MDVLPGDEVDVQLALGRGSAVGQLDGFKTRALKGGVAPPAQKHLYASTWLSSELDSSSAEPTPLTVLGDALAAQQNSSSSIAAAAGTAGTLVVALGQRRGQMELRALPVIETAFSVLQAQTVAAVQPTVWVLTSGMQRGCGAPGVAHAGSHGLLRAARLEEDLPLLCLDAALSTAQAHGARVTEPEAVLAGGKCSVPRLAAAPAGFGPRFRLGFHSRGAISNLYIEAQTEVPPLGEDGVLVSVHAVGLNFRDVLNVLGEYPGDPGPPGLDVSGVVEAAPDGLTNGSPVLGIGYAPFASLASSRIHTLAPKPTAI